MSKLTQLFEPIKLGSLELPNRIIFPAVTTLYDTHYDLKGNEHSAHFYAERAKGGAGLLIIGALQALYPGRRGDFVAINSDKYIPELRVWTKAVHDNGGRAAAQLAVWNYWAKGGEGTPIEDVSPSGVIAVREGLPEEFRHTQFGSESRPLTVEEIHMIEEQIGQAAVRAVEAGFDAIELPAVMGNLLGRFITPFTNRRTDEYGGSLENRLRMLLETTAIIKKKVGNSFPLICRITGDDLMLPWGLKLEDSKKIAPFIEKAGAHAISIMPGWYETRGPRVQACLPRGAFVYLAEGIKQVVNIPVVTSQRINDPILAEQILTQGKADLIAMGRALIADPELPNKVKEGRLDDILLCTVCDNCFDDYAAGEPISCSVNARAGKEVQYIVSPTEKPLKVFVIGGGPAGMEAAKVAAMRGHQVTLFEKQNKLGGQLLAAVIPPYKEEWNSFIKYLTIQLQKLQVETRLNEEATARTVEEAKPDAVIIATGAVPLILDIPGIDGENVVTAIDVLLRKKEIGQNVVVVGGGLVGCETAEFLHQKGKKVTILEMLPNLGNRLGRYDRWIVLDRLTKAGLRMRTNTKVVEITKEGVRAAHDGSPEFFEADSVVIAAGMKVEDTLSRELEVKVATLYKIGDCVEPRKVREAIHEAFETSYQL